ncbi:MAG TPA: DUF2971 domain-containing protein [Candidatus Dormibacteraeota bacterium]|nr:DUF2971 domain-containing protein [Candidatus Dormibacteraeota bacterium]
MTSNASGIPRRQDLLYHYTDAAGLIGILESQRLWASNAAYLNDPTELLYARGIYREWLDARTDQGIAKDLVGHVRVIDSLLEHIFHVFVACFCRKGDLLSQWRGYGSGGRGFAIGIDRQMIGIRTPLASPVNFFVARVLYDQTEQKAELSALLDPILDELAEAERHQGAGAASSMMTARLGQIQRACLLKLVTFKHPAYKAEDEWRAISIYERDVPTTELHFRAHGSLLIPYVKLDLSPSAGHQTGKIPISEVIYGPTMNPPLTEKSLRLLLDKHGYPWTHTTIWPSEIPLRQMP